MLGKSDMDLFSKNLNSNETIRNNLISEKITINRVKRLQRAFRFYRKTKKIIKDQDKLMFVQNNASPGILAPNNDQDSKNLIFLIIIFILISSTSNLYCQSRNFKVYRRKS